MVSRRGPVFLVGGDEPERGHAGEHGVAFPGGTLQVAQGGETIRAADEAGHHGGLGKVELRAGLAEIRLAGRLDPVQARAVEDAVDVKFEDLVLGIMPLDAQGDERLEDLAVERFAAQRQAVAGELLGERAGALCGAVPGDVAHDGARDAARVHAVVAVEAGILAGHERLHEALRHVLERHADAVGPVVELAVGVAVHVIDDGALGHFTEVVDVERAGPQAVKGAHPHDGQQHREQKQVPPAHAPQPAGQSAAADGGRGRARRSRIQAGAAADGTGDEGGGGAPEAGGGIGFYRPARGPAACSVP